MGIRLWRFPKCGGKTPRTRHMRGNGGEVGVGAGKLKEFDRGRSFTLGDLWSKRWPPSRTKTARRRRPGHRESVQAYLRREGTKILQG